MTDGPFPCELTTQDTRKQGGNVKRRLVVLAVVAFALACLEPALADATPTPVSAFYVYGSTASALNSNCYNYGYAFFLSEHSWWL